MNMLRKEIYDRVKSNDNLRKSLVPYLTNADDPYFDAFWAITCFHLPEKHLERIITEHENIGKLLEVMKKATICEIGKGAYSCAFRLFGRDYLAITEPWNPSYPDAPPPEEYEGTVKVEEFIDLRHFPEHSLYGKEFDITLSHSLLGKPSATHLIAGRPSKHFAVLSRSETFRKRLYKNKEYQEFHTSSSIRNMLAVFSNITKQGRISVHRCDSIFFKKLGDDNYLKTIGFYTEALLEPEVRGGFIDEEVIAVLRKTHNPKDGIYQIYVGASEILQVKEGKCGIKEVADKFE